MERRKFLILTAAGAGATLGGLAVASVGAGVTTGAAPAARPELAVTLGTEVVREIGRAYRQVHPGEDDANVLRRAIRVRVGSALGEAGTSAADAHPGTVDVPSLREAIRADFASGQIVQVDGWMLARTEARQCALYSIEG